MTVGLNLLSGLVITADHSSALFNKIINGVQLLGHNARYCLKANLNFSKMATVWNEVEKSCSHIQG